MERKIDPSRMMQDIQDSVDVKKMPKFSAPADVCTLPSGGKLYKGVPPTLEFYYITAKDEDMFTSPALIQNTQLALSTLFNKKLVNKDVPLDKFVRGDRQKLLIDFFICSYGADYNIELTDPVDGRPFKTTIKLDELEIQELGAVPDAKGEFSFVLPKTKINIKFRLLSFNDERIIFQQAQEEAQADNSKELHFMSKKLTAMIQEMNGDRDKLFIQESLETIPAGDSAALRRYIREIEPGVETTVAVRCPSGQTISYTLPGDISFFWLD